MKTNYKFILPLLLISTLLLLFVGCVVTPSDEEPGVTGTGTIIGTIASPCCSLSADPVAETCCVSPEYWCYYCQQNWNLQDGIEVVLTYGEDIVAITTTNADGEYTFTDVSPGSNYVVTAYCPDYDDSRPLVKDVALEVASTFDTKITDLASTSLGLVVDFLVYYTEWGPEDISLDAVIADKPTFPNFPKFKALIYEVRRVLENCELNLLTDDDVQYATCRAAEEISGLDIGCGPGYTPPPPPPGACDGNIAPSIDSVLLDAIAVSIGETVHVIVNTPYIITINASDDGVKDTLVYYASVEGVETPAITSNQVTVTPLIVGSFEVYAFAHDGCVETQWGPVTVEVHDECYGNEGPFLAMPEDDTVNPDSGPYTWDVTGSDPDGILGTLSYRLVSVSPTPTNDFTVNATSGQISWDPDCDDVKDRVDTVYTVTVEIDDGCNTEEGSFNVTLNALPCLCLSAALDDLDLKTNKSDHNINLALAEASFDSIVVPNGANHLWFRVSRECEDSTAIQYNYYDGSTCGAYWESAPGTKPVYPDPLDDPPAWISITIASDDEWWPNNGSTPGISICQNGGNILKLKITNTYSLETKVYTVVLNRGD